MLLYIKDLCEDQKSAIVFNERMKSQASLQYNEAVNVNRNWKGEEGTGAYTVSTCISSESVQQHQLISSY